MASSHDSSASVSAALTDLLEAMNGRSRLAQAQNDNVRAKLGEFAQRCDGRVNHLNAEIADLKARLVRAS